MTVYIRDTGAGVPSVACTKETKGWGDTWRFDHVTACDFPTVSSSAAKLLVKSLTILYLVNLPSICSFIHPSVLADGKECLPTHIVGLVGTPVFSLVSFPSLPLYHRITHTPSSSC